MLDTSKLKRIDLSKLRSLDLGTLKQPWQGKWGASLQGNAVNLDAGVRVISPVNFVVNSTAITSMREAIGRLPTAEESIHLWIGGKHSMQHILAAVLELAAPATIEELHISSLSFSKDNANELATYIDDRKLKAVTIICSQYFEKTSNEIFLHALNLLEPRGGKVFSIRTHCKIIAARLSDGQTVTAFGSANLRSAKTVENVTITGAPEVYAFHVSQIKRAEGMTANQMELPTNV